MRYPQVAIGFHLVVSIVMVIHALEDLGAPPYIVLGIFHVYVYHLYNIYIYIVYICNDTLPFTRTHSL